MSLTTLKAWLLILTLWSSKLRGCSGDIGLASEEERVIRMRLLTEWHDVQVWRKGGGFTPLALYAVQLALNLAWSPIFFKKHELGFALADVTGAAFCLPRRCLFLET